MIYTVLINCRETGNLVYFHNRLNDISADPDDLSLFIHLVEKVYSSKEEKLTNDLKTVKFEQFQVTIKDNTINWMDNKGSHNKVYYHSNQNYQGFFSVHDNLNYKDSKELFKSLTSKLDPEKTERGLRLNKKVKSELDNVYLNYCNKLSLNEYLTLLF